MPTLKNLTSLKRNITRRLKEALQELHENLGNLGNLGNLERAPIPVRVPVPVRVPAPFRGTPRNYFRLPGVAPGCFGPTNFFGAAQPRNSPFGRYARYPSSRFFSTYNRFGGFNSWRWARINQSLIFQNFSSKSQFRSKSFHRFYRAPTLTQLLKKKSGALDENVSFSNALIIAAAAALPKVPAVPTTFRLNISLTSKFHDLVLDLARPVAGTDSVQSVGCYVDFKLEPRILVPSATIMSSEIMGELLANLKRFERQIADLQQDLHRLSELGELPLKFVSSESVIRVYFPNCDRGQLENLLVEKNVLGGVIHEDVADHCRMLHDDESVTSISEFDILSSCNSMSSASTGSESADCNYDDVLSSSAGSEDFDNIVHLEPVSHSAHVEIADDYCWA